MKLLSDKHICGQVLLSYPLPTHTHTQKVSMWCHATSALLELSANLHLSWDLSGGMYRRSATITLVLCELLRHDYGNRHNIFILHKRQSNSASCKNHFFSLSKNHKMSTNYSFTHTAARGKSKRDKGYFFNRLAGTFVNIYQAQLLE